MLKEKEKSKEETKEVKESIGILVMDEIPKQDVRIVTDDSGNKYEVVTTAEAIQEILEKIRKIEKAL